jgi:hypothetical protein
MDQISTEPTSIPELWSKGSAGEDLIVDAWRVEQLRRLGLSRLLAMALAAEVDWHELADLLGRGCPLDLALEIVC